MKLLFFISSLQCGGAERVCVTLCNHWADRGWEITLATFDDGSEAPFFPLSPRVRHVTLGLQRRSTGLLHSVANNLRRVPRLRRFVAAERPERILSFIDGTNVLGLDLRVVKLDATNVRVNPVFGLGDNNATHWSVKVNYAVTY